MSFAAELDLPHIHHYPRIFQQVCRERDSYYQCDRIFGRDVIAGFTSDPSPNPQKCKFQPAPWGSGASCRMITCRRLPYVREGFLGGSTSFGRAGVAGAPSASFTDSEKAAIFVGAVGVLAKVPPFLSVAFNGLFFNN